MKHFDSESVKTYAEIVQALFTVLAILIGGIWTYMLFIRKRHHCPQVKICIDVDDVIVPQKKRLVHTELRISNIGNEILRLENVELRLREVIPLPSEIESKIASEQDLVADGETEIKWPLIDERNWDFRPTDMEIEPGETDSLHADFIIDSNIEVCQFYAYVQNPKKKSNKLGWPLTKMYIFSKEED